MDYPELNETSLTTFVQEQNRQIQFLYTQLHEQRKLISELQNELAILKESKSEIYYQRFLEKQLGASHKVTKYGITDITTDSEHIEIKHWKHFKACLGQLKSYNHGDSKQLIAALYGDEYKKKQDVIDLFHSHDISVWELNDSPNGIVIVKHVKEIVEDDGHTVNSINDFHKWLDQHLQYKEGSVLKLQETIECFLNKPIPSRHLSIYRNQLENYISYKYNKNSKYKQFWLNGKKYKGWLHFSIF